jgi:hypothetical protein
MLGLLGLRPFNLSVEEEGLMQAVLGLLSVGTLLATVLFLRLGLLLLVGLSFGVLMGGLWGVRQRLVVRGGFVVADDLVFVTEDLLLGLEQLQVGGCRLRQLVEVLHFEFTRHLSIIRQLPTSLPHIEQTEPHRRISASSQ